MIVAGIGCRKSVAASEIISAIAATAAAHGLQVAMLDAIAVPELKQGNNVISDAAREIGVPLSVVGDAALRRTKSSLLTHSPASLAATGVGSVSEAAALAASGGGSRLLGPRLVTGNVTCAIAVSKDHS